ncbi:MAG: circadian clock protein KaiC [Methanobacteriota archaeon]|nr:MAG: circadian clock protein KaiC [Euryarchaeota archaeon]
MVYTGSRRIKTFVKGLDEQIESGIPVGTVNLISGTPGSMKSSLAYSILYHNAVKIGLNGLYISMEQDVRSLTEQMKRLGMKEKTDKLLVEDYTSLDKKLRSKKFQKLKFEHDWISRIKTYIESLEKQSFDLMVLDSLDALYALTDLENPRTELYHFFKTLRETEATSFLISEMTQNTDKFSKYGVEEFLCDGIIHLDFKRTGTILSRLERFIGIVKLRNTAYSTQYFPLQHGPDGFTILTREDLEL